MKKDIINLTLGIIIGVTLGLFFGYALTTCGLDLSLTHKGRSVTL